MFYRIRPMSGSIVVLERGEPLAFSFEDMLRHHGGGSPAGVAHAFKVLERALPLLGPDGAVERRELGVRTAFGGPGARDGFELVTAAVSDGRYVVDAALARPDRGLARERFVFELSYRGRAVTLAAREGFVPDELILLARREDRTEAEERRFAAVKREAAETVMAAAAADVYERLG
jgi:hypothetical protein